MHVSAKIDAESRQDSGLPPLRQTAAQHVGHVRPWREDKDYTSRHEQEVVFDRHRLPPLDKLAPVRRWLQRANSATQAIGAEWLSDPISVTARLIRGRLDLAVCGHRG